MKIGKLRISKVWLVVIVIVILIIGYFVFKSLTKNPLDGYIIEKAAKGEVLQSISETGSVQATDNVDLGFKVSGRVQRVMVNVGDTVASGQVLAELDASQLAFQLKNYQAALDGARAEHEKLVNGYTPEDIKTYEDARDLANADLNSGYSDAINDLKDAYVKAYNAFTVVFQVQSDYFSLVDQAGIKVSDNRSIVEDNLAKIKSITDPISMTSGRPALDNGISLAVFYLNSTFSALKNIREVLDEGIYYTRVSSTSKTSIDTQRANINTAITNLTSDEQSIASYKIALQKAESSLTLRKAKPRQEDIDASLASIRQAEANVSLYQAQLSDTSIKSPIAGTITKVDAKAGEVVTANSSVIKMLSSNPFQIKVDIYEQDIVNVKIGDAVKINLVAFPRQDFEGKVISIDPGEKIVDNVVYYEVTIDFPRQPEGIMSGMTADIVILSNKKDNVLGVPKSAIFIIDGESTVEIVKDGKVKEQEVTAGLEGDDYFEVLSGLNEGQEIVTGKK